MQQENKAFHCKFCAPDAAVYPIVLGGIWNPFFFHCQYFFEFFLVCATGRCVFSLHWGLCAPVTPVTLSHLVPAIAIDIFLFQLCIDHIHVYASAVSPFYNSQLVSATIF